MRRHLILAAALVTATAPAACDRKSDSAPPASQPQAAAPSNGSDAVAPSRPPLPTGKDRARRKSASNLHQIGLAILLYQIDHDKSYPANLGVLVGAENIGLDVFVSPATGHVPPAEMAMMSVDDKAAWVNADGDYGYVRPAEPTTRASSQDVADAARRMLCYEKPDATGDDGLTLLYADGHAEWVPTATAKRQIADAERAAAAR